MTRPPMWDDWRLNIFRGMKENRMKMDANKLARRKCWETGENYGKCINSHGKWFGHRHCGKEFTEFVDCCNFEREVELDKMRRDTVKNTEWYWLNIYDEHGEIGKQAEWNPESGMNGVWKSMYYQFTSRRKLKDLVNPKADKEK